MNWGERAREAIVGGLGGLVVVIAFILVRSLDSKAPIGEWLGFAGAATGAGLAVLGAVALERWKQARQRKYEAASIRAAIVRLRAIAILAQRDRPNEISEPDWQSLINQTPENLRSYLARLDRALDRLTSATIDLDVIEAGDSVLRAGALLDKAWTAADKPDASGVLSNIDLLKTTCDLAIGMLTGIEESGWMRRIDEEIEGRGRRIQ